MTIVSVSPERMDAHCVAKEGSGGEMGAEDELQPPTATEIEAIPANTKAQRRRDTEKAA
jgi:hypothetical protein